MSLSTDLIQEFAKLTNDTKNNEPTNTNLYGTIVEYENSKWVRIDGSELLTPISTITNVSNGDRVVVGIQNHTAIVNGNLTAPSANNRNVEDLGDVVAGKVSADELEAAFADIQVLLADYAKISYVEAEYARIDALDSSYVKTEALEAERAEINAMFADYATINILESQYATIESLRATNARIDSITSSGIDTDYLNANFANINLSNITKAAMENFYANSGLISNVTINNGVITGDLTGVTISGDLIKANTIVANKLVVQGTNGLYYKLNTDGIKVEASQTDYNSLNGSVIKAKSITATKINVSDLVAFGATIGGFYITDSAIHSYLKDDINSEATGVYLDKNGQMVIGDPTNYIKYYKDTDNKYKLKIAASDITFSSTGKTVQDTIDDISVGGRNLLLGSGSGKGWTNYTSFDPKTREFTKSNNTINENMFYCNNKFNLEAGQTYTLSFKAKQNGQLKNTYRDVYVLPGTWASTGIAYNPKITGLTTEYQEYVFTFVPNPNATSLIDCRLRFDNEGSKTAGTDAVLYIRDVKLEKGNKATDWTPAPEDFDADILAASKTATNFMSYDSTNGLLIGNKSSGSWSGNRAQITSNAFNVLNSSGTQLASFGSTATIGLTSSQNIYIDSDSVDIRKGNTVLASFDANTIQLGNNSSLTRINLCGGVGSIYAQKVGDVYQGIIVSAAKHAAITGSATELCTSIEDPQAPVLGRVATHEGYYVDGDHTGYYANSSIKSEGGASQSFASVAATAYADYTDAHVNINAHDGTNTGMIEVYPTYINLKSPTNISKPVSITDTLTVAGQSTFNNAVNMKGGVEIFLGTPFIDFHFGNSTADYTSRIIEQSSGILTVTGGLKIGTDLYFTTNNKRVYWKDANGTDREVMRLNNSTDTPTLILGDGLYSAGIGQVNIASGKRVMLLTSTDRVSLEISNNSAYSAFLYPTSNGTCVLGKAANRWHSVYAANGTIQTSDRREKENIIPLGANPVAMYGMRSVPEEQIDIHSELFDRLQPVQYNFINGDGRTNYGLIAQDVISAMEELGIDENELGLVYHEWHTDEETGEEKDTYGIAYANLIALLIHEVQKLKTEVHKSKGEQNNG